MKILKLLFISILVVGIFEYSFATETVIPKNFKVFTKKIIKTTNTDENYLETFIIKNDKKNYSELSKSTVFFSITNTRQVEDAFIQINTEYNEDILSLQKIETNTIYYTEDIIKYEPSVCNDITPGKEKNTFDCEKPTVVGKETKTKTEPIFIQIKEGGEIFNKTKYNKKTSGIATAKKSFYDTLQTGTTFYKAEIKYTPGTKSEFYIEAIGTNGGYGLLDPGIDSSWGRTASITFNHLMASSTESNFPVLLSAGNLPDEMITTGNQYASLSTGCDIRFSSDEAGTTEIPFEIVHYNQNAEPDSANAEIWVNVPTLSNSTDTVIYIWYSNPSASCYAPNDTYGRENVWGLDYKAVHHLSTYTDSTSFHSNAVKTVGVGNDTASTTGIGGITNSAVRFNGVNNYDKRLSLGNNDTDLNLGSTFTLSYWLNSYTFGTNCSGAVSKMVAGAGTYSYIMTNGCTTASTTEFYTGSAWKPSTANKYIGSPVWNYVSTKLVGGSMIFFINGVPVSTTTSVSYTDRTDNYTVIGGWGTTYRDYTMRGTMDEVRISNAAKSNGWIGTEYNNLISPLLFSTAGIPDCPGGCSAPSVQSRASIINKFRRHR